MSKRPKEIKKPVALFDYGTLVDLDTFQDDCDSGCLIDYDGYGQYSDGEYVYNKIVYPSDALAGNLDHRYPYIMWFNR